MLKSTSSRTDAARTIVNGFGLDSCLARETLQAMLPSAGGASSMEHDLATSQEGPCKRCYPARAAVRHR